MRAIPALIVLCQVGLSWADAQCSDSPGSCKAAPRASLMQLRALNLNQKQKHQTQFSSQLAAFQKFTDELIAKYGQPAEGESANGDPDAFQKDTQLQRAVQTVLEFIDAMYTSLRGYHNNDVTAAENCAAGKPEAACTAQQLTPGVQTNISFYNRTAQDTHRDYLKCMSDRKTACEAETAQCHDYDTYRQQKDDEVNCEEDVLVNGDEPQYLPDCFSQNEAGDTSHQLDFGTVFGQGYINAEDVNSMELKAMEACLVKTNIWLNGRNAPPTPAPPAPEGDGTWLAQSSAKKSRRETPACDFNSKYDGLYPLYLNCDRVRHDCNNLHEICSRNQTTFENAYCYYEQAFDGHCGGWEACYKHKISDCSENTCPTILDNVIGRKADNETGERVRCLLQVLFGEWNGTAFLPRLNSSSRMTALTACTETEYDDMAKDWDISCEVGDNPQLPALCNTHCPADVMKDHVHTQEFVTEYYIYSGLTATDPLSELKAHGDHGDAEGVAKEIFKTSPVCGEYFNFQHEYTLCTPR